MYILSQDRTEKHDNQTTCLHLERPLAHRTDLNPKELHNFHGGSGGQLENLWWMESGLLYSVFKNKGQVCQWKLNSLNTHALKYVHESKHI